MVNVLKFVALFASPRNHNMLTSLFVISLSGLVALLGTKMYEVSRQKQTFAGKALSRFDSTVQENLDLSKDVYEKQMNRVESFVKEELPKQTKETMVLVRDSAKKKYSSLFPNIRGVRTFRTARDASLFLQDISKERERDGKGRIEDDGISGQ